MSHDLLPIGTFSKLCKLSIKALRHYQDIGVLKPALIDRASGYRYYSISQAAEAERIRQLRALDMPLDEIRQVLKHREFTEVKPLLERHRERILDRKKECERALDFIEKLMDSDDKGFDYRINRREVVEQAILSISERTSLKVLDQVFGKAFGELFGYLGSLGRAPAGPPLCLYHAEEFDPDDVELEICIPTAEKLAGKGRIYGKVLEGGPVVSTLHSGPYSELGPAYQALCTWLQDNGFEPKAAAREIYLVGPGMASDESEYRTEICWPLS